MIADTEERPSARDVAGGFQGDYNFFSPTKACDTFDLQESSRNRQDSSTKVVGPAPKALESSGREVLEDKKRKTLEMDISEYLLLHHNYAAKPPAEKERKTRTLNRRKLKVIRPKINTNVLNTNKLAVDLHTPIVIEDDESNNLLYNGGCNEVTIIVDDNGIPINETVTEIVAMKENQTCGDETDVTPFLTVPTLVGNASPRSISSSDNGYESLDSPQSLSDLDIWDQSVTELFPSLF